MVQPDPVTLAKKQCGSSRSLSFEHHANMFMQ